MNFHEQMSSFREKQKTKYENRLMNEEDLESANYQKFIAQKMMEEKKQKEIEEMNRIQQQIIEEEIRREKKQQKDFIDEYVVAKLEKMKNQFIDIDELINEAKQVYERKQLIHQQDKEYEQSLNVDKLK